MFINSVDFLIMTQCVFLVGNNAYHENVFNTHQMSPDICGLSGFIYL